MSPTDVKKVLFLAFGVIALCSTLFLSGKLVEFLPADEIMVIQYPDGKLRACTEPGYYGQWFGNTTKYKRRTQFWFSGNRDGGAKQEDTTEDVGAHNNSSGQKVTVRFNDNAHAQMSGSLSLEIPSTPEDLLRLHKMYATQDRVMDELIAQQANKSIYMTGSLMSSKESAAEKRPELLNYLEDQIQNGVYRTQNQTRTDTDPTTSMTRTIVIASIMMDKDGKPQRVEESLLKQFKIRASSVSINNISYDEKVEAQLQLQQQATMDIQTAMVESKKAQQREQTVEAEGRAKAAQAKWEQEAIKARAVTEAEQIKTVAETEAKKKLEVAILDAKAAEQFKIAETLRGEGEAARRLKVMEADGALDKKLQAYVEVNMGYANALSKFQGNLVPSIVMGSNGASGGSAADFMNLIAMKAAKDLSLDLSTSQTSTRK